MRVLRIIACIVTVLALVCQVQAATWRIQGYTIDPVKHMYHLTITSLATGKSRVVKGQQKDLICFERYYGQITGAKPRAKNPKELREELDSVVLSYSDEANEALELIFVKLANENIVSLTDQKIGKKFFTDHGLNEMFLARLMGKTAALSSRKIYIKPEASRKGDPKPSQRIVLVTPHARQSVLITPGANSVIRNIPMVHTIFQRNRP